MILLDTALAQREAEGRPIRIGLVGAGFMGRGIAGIRNDGTGAIRSRLFPRLCQ